MITSKEMMSDDTSNYTYNELKDHHVIIDIINNK